MINSQLDDNQRKRQEGLRKQIKRKIDIHDYVLSQGGQIGYTTCATIFVTKNYGNKKPLSNRLTYREKNVSLTGPSSS